MASRRRFLSLLGAAGATGMLASQTVALAADGEAAEESPPAQAEFIQPDYKNWQRLKLGMKVDEVLDLLGEPLYRQDTDPKLIRKIPKEGNDFGDSFHFLWQYGKLDFAHPAMPASSFGFYLLFQSSTRKLTSIDDPFDGALSPDGIPTTPRLMLPADKSIWKHYPRFLDLRWQPSSGQYPIRYEIEWSWFHEALGDRRYLDQPRRTSSVPYYALGFLSAAKGRWRVRAENELGRSDWSDYRYFEFTA